jgi:hypothetical protein
MVVDKLTYQLLDRSLSAVARELDHGRRANSYVDETRTHRIKYIKVLPL